MVHQPGGLHARHKKGWRTRARQPWLAGYVPYVLILKLTMTLDAFYRLTKALTRILL